MISYEEKSLNAWPSLKTLIFKGCLIRLSNGYTKRANSANPLYIKETNIPEIIKFSESIFTSSNLPTVFKITNNITYKKMDSELKRLNYEKRDVTNVMLFQISESNTPADKLVQINSDFSDEWINAFIEINNVKNEYISTTIQMLHNISVNVLVASIKVDNKIIACGYGACEGDHVGFYDIIVADKYRGNGYGKKLMSGLIYAAKKQNISNAYLQVVDTNKIANELYSKLGFKKIYEYWYRIKDL